MGQILGQILLNMQNLKATASYYLDKRSIKKQNKHSVKISVYYDGEKRRYHTGIDLKQIEWEKIWNANLRDGILKQAKRAIEQKKQAIESLIGKLDPFSFAEFESLFFQNRKIRKTTFIADLFEEYIQMLEKEERIGTAMSYRSTINSLIAFKGNKKIGEINRDFLRDYEKHLALEGKSPSTTGIYMRQLRRIFNYSIDIGVLPAGKYPFKGYSIPASRNIKKSLNEQQVKSLLGFQTTNKEMRKGLDFWLFSYLGNGMNMTDICFLKKDNIQAEFFSFFRAKTKNTKKKDLRPIRVPLLSRSIEIIQRWRNDEPDNPYLFSVLQSSLSAKQIKFRIQDFVKFVNGQMKKVAKELGILDPIGTYVARHTHSTILKRKGASTEMIKENLGHSSVITTESYLDDFEDEVKQEFAKMLVDL